jgi:hypothetical protein
MSNYPDPTIEAHGPPEDALPPGINTDTPTFKRAGAACRGE